MEDLIIITDTNEVRQQESPYAGRIGAFAQSMMAPIRRRLDYQGLARRILAVDPLPPGGAALYYRDGKDD